MSRQKYIPQDNQWMEHPPFDREGFAEAVYTDVGTRFPLTVNSDGSVLIDPDLFPDGVAENDVKQAIRDNHPHR